MVVLVVRLVEKLVARVHRTWALDRTDLEADKTKVLKVENSMNPRIEVKKMKSSQKTITMLWAMLVDLLVAVVLLHRYRSHFLLLPFQLSLRAIVEIRWQMSL